MGKLSIQYNTALPIVAEKSKIIQAIKDHPVVVVAGETGSGKTTQLPKFCLEAGRGASARIAHTQPRRIAARSVAGRIAEELCAPLGSLVGYQVRFEQKISKDNIIRVLTDGLLLSQLAHDPYLNAYDTIIVDEAHERSLNIDFLLGVLKRILKKRKDLKVIITSATIDVERFADFFGGAPIFQISGRTYPVDVIYRGPESWPNDTCLSLEQQILAIVEEIYVGSAVLGDTLVFLPGEREIRQVSQTLRRKGPNQLACIPLYARLSAKEQLRVFKSSQVRRVILATNVAETSLTVPNIGYVIDSGTARISRYSVRQKVQQLPIEPISKASANQRAGRCGRVMNGVCFRLYSEQDFNNRPDFTPPEVLRTHLASVILQMLFLKLGPIEQFELLEPPTDKLIRDGYQLLLTLGALSETRLGQFRLTGVGRKMAHFPLDAKIARLLLAASDRGCLQEMWVIVGALSVTDVRHRPFEQRQAAYQAHKGFRVNGSDFLTDLKLFNVLQQKQADLSRSAFKDYCEAHFISHSRWFAWRDTYRQLKQLSINMKLCVNTLPADPAQLHRALLSAFATQIAVRCERSRLGVGDYLSTRSRRCVIHPSSVLFKAKPKWWVCAYLIETHQLQAHKCAEINPEWVIEWVPGLLKYQDTHPFYDKRKGFVIAKRETSLFGLSLKRGEKVNFGSIDPDVARAIFIQSALVNGELVPEELEKKFAVLTGFMKHNRQLCEDIEYLEQKARRSGLLASETERAEFFSARIPEKVCDRARFFHWWQVVMQQTPNFLNYDISWLQKSQSVDQALFPDNLRYGDRVYALAYQFRVGDEIDGVTLKLPLSDLFHLPSALPDWLVPGLLRGKCEALIRGLPKRQRKYWMPIGSFVEQFMAAEFDHDQPLVQALTQFAGKLKGSFDESFEWPTQIENVHKMTILVVGPTGECLDRGTSIEKLRERYRIRTPNKGTPKNTLNGRIPNDNRTVYESWPNDLGSFQSRPDSYLCLRVVAHGVCIDWEATAQGARQQTHLAAVKICSIRFKSCLNKWRKSLVRAPWFFWWVSLFEDKQSTVAWLDSLVCERLLLLSGCVVDLQTLNHEKFEGLVNQCRQIMGVQINQLEGVLETVSVAAQRAQGVFRRGLGSYQQRAQESVQDIEQQIRDLMCPEILSQSAAWIDRLPIYWQAIDMRLERLNNNLARDLENTAKIKLLNQQWSKKDQTLTPVQRNQSEWSDIPWWIQEYRISLFAQPLKTKIPISEKRILDKIRTAAR